MSLNQNQSTAIDNVETFVHSYLTNLLNAKSEIFVVADSFSINAYQELQSSLNQVKSFKFLYAKPTFISAQQNQNESHAQLREFYIHKLKREHSLFGSDLEIKLHNKLTQKHLSKQCLDWIEQKCQFKSMRIADEAHFILIKNQESYWLISGVKDFSAVELGFQDSYKRSTFSKLYYFIEDQDKAQEFYQQFKAAWQNRNFTEDVTATVKGQFQTVYQETAPETIYYHTLNYIFSEFVDEANEDYLPNDQVNYKNSAIWRKLFNYQKDAALAIINKLEKYNGCILADSVGLGKTFTALAVINYYTLRNKNILVLCPKKLYSNWNLYIQNNKNNILLEDRFNYKLLHHTDITRTSGISTSGIDLDGFNWNNFDLIVIDESHSFRNGGNIQNIYAPEGQERKLNRYETLLKQAICGGVKTKVLMLSATPVNNRFSDLKNQLALAYECNIELINDALRISTDINTVFKEAQQSYNHWSNQELESRTTKSLANALSQDFFKILDAFTIARSRKHIETFYENANNEIGSFPRRLKPISYEPSITDLPNVCQYCALSARMQELHLACYSPSEYILPSKSMRYTDNQNFKFDLEFTGREKGLIRLMTISLFKRLESSVYSLSLTVQKLIDKQDELLERIANFKLANQKSDKLNILDEIQANFDFDEGEDFEEQGFSLETDSYVGSKNTVISFADLDLDRWSTDIAQDKAILEHIANEISKVTPEHDLKLKKLIEVIENKCAHPINQDNRKILIFTAFANTAHYLYDELTNYFAHHKSGLNFALVEGDARKNCCTLKLKKKHLDDILSCFSPRSKQRNHPSTLDGIEDEIDILIATDCISEGQNLQDCDYVVNYDIHWNPVRLIQRFGRVDRIGSTNQVIQMVNFWPEISLDEYIKLKPRVVQRMQMTVITSTGDDNILEEEKDQMDLEYRKKQLEHLKNDTVDIEEVSGGLNIMDLGLNEFRQDLLAYTKNHPKLKELPNGLSALVQIPNGHNANAHKLISPFSSLKIDNNLEQRRLVGAQRLGLKPGIILILRNNNSTLKDDKNNILHPFYMVYIDENSNIVCNQSNPKQILEILRFLCRDQIVASDELCRAFNEQTNNYENMESYSKLLKQAVNNIVEQKNHNALNSLFQKGPSSASTGAMNIEQDFELLDFLIISP